jgi:hypothetical protein
MARLQSGAAQTEASMTRVVIEAAAIIAGAMIFVATMFCM